MSNEFMTNDEMQDMIKDTIANVDAEIASMTPAELDARLDAINRKMFELMQLRPKRPYVVCLDCGWKGPELALKAQACPVCDGRCADV